MLNSDNKIKCIVKKRCIHDGLFYGVGTYEIREDHALEMARSSKIPWNSALRKLNEKESIGKFEEPEDQEPDNDTGDNDGDNDGDSDDNDSDEVSAFIQNLSGKIDKEFPGYKALEELGITTFEKLPKTRDSLEALDGIGSTTVEKIGLKFAEMEEEFEQSK